MITKEYYTHGQMRHHLEEYAGRNCVIQMCHYYLPYTRKIPDNVLKFWVYNEVTIRERDNAMTNRYGGEKPDHYRFDVVLTVMPGSEALNQDKTFMIGIELKGSLQDLISDKKFIHYRDWTHLLFFAVPKQLVPAALEKLERYQDIGVISIETGYIIKYPLFKVPDLYRQNELLKQLIYNYKRV